MRLTEGDLNVVQSQKLFGVGAYSVPEAARLLRLSPRNVRRWFGGYKYALSKMPALWRLEHPRYDNHLELGFRDLIELKIVSELLKNGLTIKTVRRCLEEAKTLIDDSHPFTTQKFKSDGMTIFLEQMAASGESQLLDLKRNQFALSKIIEQSFKDLDLDNDLVARWRPFKSKNSIVIDPNRSFGQPIANEAGIPTIVLFDAFKAEGKISSVARLFEVSQSSVRDAVAFEEGSAAA